MLEELQLTAKKMLKQEAMSVKLTRYDGAQRDAIARPQEKTGYYERMRDTCLKRKEAGTCKSSDVGQSPNVRKPKNKCKEDE